MRCWRGRVRVRAGVPGAAGGVAAGREVFAEVALPEEAAAEAAGFGVHPALLDACCTRPGWLRRAVGGPATTGRIEDGLVRLPFAWAGVGVHASGASELRVRLRRGRSGGLSLAAADPSGGPGGVGRVAGSRPAPAGQLAAPGVAGVLFTVDWVAVPAAAGGAAGPAGAGASWAVVGADPWDLAAGLAGAGAEVTGCRDLGGLGGDGGAVPDLVAVCAGDLAVRGGVVAWDGLGLAGGALAAGGGGWCGGG